MAPKNVTKYFGKPKKSHDLNFIREKNRVTKNVPTENSGIKVIKAPKFSNKAYEKTLKLGSGKSGRNETNIENNFKFVFQPGQLNTSNKARVRLSSKRNSMIPSLNNLKENAYQIEDSKHSENHKIKEKTVLNKSKLKINLKNAEIKDFSRYSQNKKLQFERHQRSNNESMPEFDSLIDENAQELNIATERHASSLIENLDQSEFIRNVIMQSKK